MGVIDLNTRVKALEESAEASGSVLDGVVAELEAVVPNSKTLVLASSTAESTKTFAITVDDDGKLTATEIVS